MVGVTLTEELASVTLSRLPLPLPPVVRDGLCALGLPQTRPGLWGTVDASVYGLSWAASPTCLWGGVQTSACLWVVLCVMWQPSVLDTFARPQPVHADPLATGSSSWCCGS